MWNEEEIGKVVEKRTTMFNTITRELIITKNKVLKISVKT